MTLPRFLLTGTRPRPWPSLSSVAEATPPATPDTPPAPADDAAAAPAPPVVLGPAPAPAPFVSAVVEFLEEKGAS